MHFYTSVSRKGNKLYERGFRDGKPYTKSFEYKPYLFVPTSEDKAEYHTIHGQPVGRMDFESMSAASKFVYQYRDVATYKVYGLTDYEFPYIYDNFKRGFDYNFKLLNVVNTDIETDSSHGFPDIATANREINAVTLAKKGKTVTLGFKPHESIENHEYIQCADETELLTRFVKLWNTREWCPDIITGWNIEFFDIPYLINRITRVLGKEWAEKLSPFRIIEKREVEQRTGKMVDTYSIFGVSIIDYYAAYKKFAMGERESYKLDYIAEVELDERKVDYSEYGSLANFYEQNPKLYYEYNIHDAVLIEKLEHKLHYIEQIVNIAYIERVNFENTLTTVKPWDVIIHNYLMDRKIVVPPMSKAENVYRIAGAFVKDPIPGHYHNVVSFDFTSLYPSLAMQYNISPDTFVKKLNKPIPIEDILYGDISGFTEELKRRDYAMTANGCLFKRDHRGFIPAIMKEFFDERKRVRGLERVAEEKYEKSKDNNDRDAFLKHKNLQTAFKLINNSGYGAVANQYFRWFASYLAEGITLSGQMTIKYVDYRVNVFLNERFKTTDIDYVIYCDTDSAYITLDALIKELGITDKTEAAKAIVKFSEEILCPFIDASCAELADKLNAFEVKTSMKLEKVCDQCFFTGKKHYALNVLYSEGIWYKEPKLKVTGLETVRSSIPKKVRKALEDCYKLIFVGDREDLINYITAFEKKFYEFKFDDIAKPSGVKNLAEYSDPRTLYKKACPIHVRGSLVYNDFIKKKKLTDEYELIEDFDKIKYCYLKLPNPTHENVISVKNDAVPKELDITSFIDYKTQFEKLFLSPIRQVSDAVKWETKKNYTLDSIFGE